MRVIPAKAGIQLALTWTAAFVGGADVPFFGMSALL
jgi:hypothetical protein